MCKISQISIKEWNKVFSVNLTSAFIISKNFKNLSKSINPSIVFVSSIAGHRKSIDGSHYVSSKAALIGLSKQLSHEFGNFKIRVNCVSDKYKNVKKSVTKKQTNKLIKLFQ